MKKKQDIIQSCLYNSRCFIYLMFIYRRQFKKGQGEGFFILRRKMVTKEEAIIIAKELYGSRCSYEIEHGVPDSYMIYGSDKWSPESIWCVRVIGRCSKMITETPQIIVISKDTGKILFDGLRLG